MPSYGNKCVSIAPVLDRVGKATKDSGSDDSLHSQDPVMGTWCQLQVFSLNKVV